MPPAKIKLSEDGETAQPPQKLKKRDETTTWKKGVRKRRLLCGNRPVFNVEFPSTWTNQTGNGLEFLYESGLSLPGQLHDLDEPSLSGPSRTAAPSLTSCPLF